MAVNISATFENMFEQFSPPDLSKTGGGYFPSLLEKREEKREERTEKRDERREKREERREKREERREKREARREKREERSEKRETSTIKMRGWKDAKVRSQKGGMVNK